MYFDNNDTIIFRIDFGNVKDTLKFQIFSKFQISNKWYVHKQDVFESESFKFKFFRINNDTSLIVKIPATNISYKKKPINELFMICFDLTPLNYNVLNKWFVVEKRSHKFRIRIPKKAFAIVGMAKPSNNNKTSFN